MAINYSLTKRRAKPTDPTSEELVYAVAQQSAKWNIRDISSHIVKHNSKYARADVEGVINTLLECMVEKMMDGVSIELGDFGIFYLALHSKGIEQSVVEEQGYSSSNIKSIRAAWRRGLAFRDLIEEAEFAQVPTRKLQQEARRTMLEIAAGLSTADKDTSQTGPNSGGDDDDEGQGSLG